MQTENGFTFIELLITMTVAIILLAVGVPSFNALVQNNRAVSLSHDFVASFNYARSEAIKRGEPVSVCAGNAALSACANAGSWTNGWLVFSDPNGDGAIANAADILRAHEALKQGASITTGQARTTFDGSGMASAGSGGYVLSATGCSGNNGRTVNIANTGRVSTAQTAC